MEPRAPLAATARKDNGKPRIYPRTQAALFFPGPRGAFSRAANHGDGVTFDDMGDGVTFDRAPMPTAPA